MTESAPLPSYRLKLPCADEREFRDRFLQKYVTRGVFVPSERPKPVGTRLKLKLEIKDGTILVSGDGMVTSVTQPGPNAKPGMTVRLTALHPESIQFSLSPSGNAPPAPRPAAPPLAAARPALSPPPLRAAPAAPPRPAAPTPPPPPPAARASDDEGLFDLSDPVPETPHAAPDEGVMSTTDPSIPVPFELLGPEEAPAESEAPQGAGSPAPTPPPGATPAGPSAPVRAPRRRLPSLRVLVLLGAAIAVVAAIAIGGTVASRKAETARRERARIDGLLRLADQRLLEGRLAAAKGDSALDHLLEAKGAAPNDERVVTRLKLLADKFEQLGDRALARRNQREAAVHFKATLMADPTRGKAREKLDDIEAKAPRAAPAR